MEKNDPIEAVLKTVAYLRTPDGCPWDRAQTHVSLQPCMMEECAEALQAIDAGDESAMAEELGDVLLQVLLHAQIASERGSFNFSSIAEQLNQKLIRRHPHVFGEASAEHAADALARWQAVKLEEKKAKGIALDSEEPLPPALPALAYASAAIRRLEKKGQVLPAIPEEFNGIDSEKALGGTLFQLVQLARSKGWEAERALRLYARSVL